ncbi:sugar ABC transporter substrate-binding protein [Gammaproteobacteria bacterium 45_16_T64]|nr:sugar ABC transporter substrate-binding protein [Gammaproteobacteria bacterium 45_16_T64]
MVKLSVLVMFLLALGGCDRARVAPAELISEDQIPVKEYQIGVGDTLAVKVWRNAELSVSVPVRPDGNISVPLVGDIKAEGVSAEDLAAGITSQLESFIRSPQVTVIVTDPSSATFLQRVRLTGAVASPTSVEYQKGMTVMDLVLLVGGVTPFADGNSTRLYRKTAGGSKIYPIYLDDILEKGDLQTNYDLRPSDIITVPERLF